MVRRQGWLIAEQFQLKAVPGKWHVEILSTFYRYTYSKKEKSRILWITQSTEDQKLFIPLDTVI